MRRPKRGLSLRNYLFGKDEVKVMINEIKKKEGLGYDHGIEKYSEKELDSKSINCMQMWKKTLENVMKTYSHTDAVKDKRQSLIQNFLVTRIIYRNRIFVQTIASTVQFRIQCKV